MGRLAEEPLPLPSIQIATVRSVRRVNFKKDLEDVRNQWKAAKDDWNIKTLHLQQQETSVV
jgi:hypothetical protein